MAAAAVRIRVPTHLFEYTGGRALLSARGGTVRAALSDLDAGCPGLLFRIVDEQGRLRRHVRVYVNGKEAGSLAARLAEGDEVTVVAALSGG